MDVLNLLQNRFSEKKLVAPAPNKEQLQEIFRAALRVPDHASLKPYQFYVLEGQEQMQKLSDLMLDCCRELDLPEKFEEKAKKFATRAPQVIVVVAKVDPNHKKVPAWEQVVTAGCATYAIQLAANSLGFDNFWVTAKWVQGTAMREYFNCQKDDQIVALLLSGTAKERKDKEDKKAVKHLDDYVTYID
ncbi:nitroreductase family protein [Psittacicella gerlachiana]|uniref:Putative NAD(P)H nitroreductase n=1 Tax=Psittacicella gerlachiana TaxID=2028574 RepID=A0A3A1YPG2_9GAMM|nr:nitroreductase family protein [Psittacicella gerlachiana]RIY37917.1 nitroreductase [Psittacicella gerlachiana]